VGLSPLSKIHEYTPKTPLGNVNDDLDAIVSRINELSNIVVLLDGSATMTGKLTTPGVRLTDTTELTLSSTGHAFQIGASNAANLAADANEIQARNNGAAAVLDLNPHGGAVNIGGNLAWHAGNDGAGSGLDADTVDGAHLSAFAHERVFLGVDDLEPEDGATKVRVTSRLTINFANAATQTASSSFALPVWAVNQNLTIVLYYISATAGTNAVRLNVTMSKPAVGTALNANTTGFTPNVAMPAGGNVLGEYTLTTTYAAGTGPFLTIFIQRDGNHANDTFTGAFNLVGVLIKRT
jgi:hypothetical protein